MCIMFPFFLFFFFLFSRGVSQDKGVATRDTVFDFSFLFFVSCFVSRCHGMDDFEKFFFSFSLYLVCECVRKECK